MRRHTVPWAALPLLLAGVAGATEPAGADRPVPERPRVTIRLGRAEASGIPGDGPCARTGGGNFVVRQPAPDTLFITLTGLAMARGKGVAASTATFNFELSQAFTVVCEGPDVPPVSLQLQGYVMGLLRSPCKGSASLVKACAAVTCDGPGPGAEAAAFCLPGRTAGPKENVSVYLRSDRLCAPAPPGCYVLHQTFAIAASQPAGGLPGHGPSAEFSTAEDDTVSFGQRHNPFEGASRKDFGFHVILKVVPLAPPVPLRQAAGTEAKGHP